jgi:hypothetical protein
VLRPQATLAFLKPNTELLPHPINEEEFVTPVKKRRICAQSIEGNPGEN